MIIRQLPPTAVVSAERVTPGDVIYGRELHDGTWQLFDPPYLVEAVRWSGMRVLIERHEAARPVGALAILNVQPYAEILISYTVPGRPRTAVDESYMRGGDGR